MSWSDLIEDPGPAPRAHWFVRWYIRHWPLSTALVWVVLTVVFTLLLMAAS